MIIDSPIISGSYLSTGSLSQTGNVSITGSLTATGGISGSFSGSGANLFDIPAAGIVGLNLSQIASGSVSASISPNQGLLINTSVSASNFTGSFTGSLTGIATSASYASFALTSSYSLGGSGFPFSGSAVITGSLIVSGSGLTITGSVAISTLTTGSGVRYVIADQNGLVSAQTASAVIFTTQQTIATAGQTVFPITNGYSTGYVTVFVNGSKLNDDEFTDTSGTNIVFATGSMINDVVEFQKYLPASGVSNNTLRTTNYFTTTLGQTNFTVNYTPGLLDVFYNGAKLNSTEYTAANGTSITLATGSNLNDSLEVDVYSYQVGAFSGIGGVGVAKELAFYNTTNSITGSNKVTYDGSTFSITGSFLVTGSSTFTNIGPAVFSGSVTAVGGFSGSFSGNADSASLAQNSLLLQGTGSLGFTTTASFLAVSGSQQQISASQQQLSSSFLTLTASYTALSSSYIALSGSYNTFSGSASTRITENSSSIQQVSASLLQVSASYIALSGSYTTFSGSASTRTTQIEQVYATTGSNSFRANQSITGSLVVSSTITAQTLIVQTVTSSIVYSSGSNIFGCDLNSRQTFTGSLNVTGSTTLNGALTGTSATFNGDITYNNAGNQNLIITSGAANNGRMYIYSAGNADIGFQASGSSWFLNKLGIGTNSPSTPLQVYSNISSSSNVTAEFYNGDYCIGTRNFIRLRNSATISSTTSAYFGQGQDQKTYIYNNDPSRLGDIVITNTGKVGIGTESPIAQLHVKTDVASASRPSTLATSATNSAAYITTICGSNAGIAFGQLGANSNYIQSTYQDGSACTPLILNPYSGNVGIGTGNTAPGGALDVVTCSNTTQNFYLRNTNNLDASSRSYFNVVAGNTSLSLLALAGGGSCGGTYIAGTCGADLYIQQAPSGNNNIVIKANGYVGINISSACKHLEVGGTIRTTASPSAYYRDMSYLGDTYQFGSSETGDNVDFKICGGSTWSTGGNFRWFTQAGNTTPSERMRITAGGSVGISATNPRTQLDVGDIHDGVGGTTFCAFLVAQCVWATFACVTNNDTNVVTDITYVNNNDYNRSGVFVARWAYNDACAALHIRSCLWNDSQNIGSFGLRNNGGALQICLSGGANGYRVQARVQGARATG